jgi:hypothetical protein
MRSGSLLGHDRPRTRPVAVRRPRAAPPLALAAVMTLALAAAPVAASADRPAPTPGPLWNAYPLGAQTETAGAPTARTASGSSDGRGTPSARSSAATAGTRPNAPAHDGSRWRSWLWAPLLATILAAVGGLLTRRDRAPEAAAPPAPAPDARVDPVPNRLLPDVPRGEAPLAAAPVEHCRIVWWQGPAGGEFRAFGTDRRGRRYVAGRSATVVDRRSPACDGTPLSMHRALIERLEKRGWRLETPNGDGAAEAWYAQSFSRVRPVERRSGERPAGQRPAGQRPSGQRIGSASR